MHLFRCQSKIAGNQRISGDQVDAEVFRCAAAIPIVYLFEMKVERFQDGIE
jgi:hypothetical protein